MLALVIAHGDAPSAGALPEPHPPTERRMVIAADGGALTAAAAGLRPDVVVGDGDSLPPDAAERLRDEGVEVIVHSAAKDESDTELAVLLAVERGATRVAIVGALGGRRFDHALANVLLLALPQLAGVDAWLTDGTTTVRLVGAPAPWTLTLRGNPGDLVSLLPLAGEADGVTTDGLAYPLRDERLTQGPARGLSNQLLAGTATVSARTGRLAVVHTPAEMSA